MNQLKIWAFALLIAIAIGYKAHQDKKEDEAKKINEAAEQEELRLKVVRDWPMRKRRFQYCIEQMTVSYNEMAKEASKKTKNIKVYKKLDKAAISCYVTGLYQPQALYDFKDSELLAEKMGELFRTYDKKTLGEISEICGDWGCPRDLYPEPDVMAAAIKDYITELSANVEALDPILKDKLTEVDR